jgi:hypothetical protein
MTREWKARLADAAAAAAFALSIAASAAPAQAGTPFSGAPVQINGTPGATTVWEAENVDLGGPGVSWFYPPAIAAPAQCATTNACYCAQTYRTDGLLVCGSPSAFVTYPGPGAWYEYTVGVSSVGSYTVELMVAMADAGCCALAAYHVEVDGAPVLDPATGGVASVPLGPAQMASWVAFEWRGKSPLFPMVAGVHRLRVVIDHGWFNWDALRVRYAAGIEWQQKPVWRVYP